MNDGRFVCNVVESFVAVRRCGGFISLASRFLYIFSSSGVSAKHHIEEIFLNGCLLEVVSLFYQHGPGCWTWHVLGLPMLDRFQMHKTSSK